MLYIRCLLISLAATSVGFAQAPAAKETLVKFTIEPMPAPVPALKYQLLPELKEMNPGNPIQGYLKATGEARQFLSGKKSLEDREKWLTAPLKELPVNELRNYGGSVLRQVDFAARLETPDWQVLLQARKEGIGMLLPDIQVMREFGSALNVRFRGEVAERRFDQAIITAKTTLGLSRHMNEHPMLIGDLVGVFIAQVALDGLEEMIQQPGCPNLFWALSILPDPFIDFRRGLQGDRLLIEVEFAELDAVSPMSDAQLQKVISRLTETLKFMATFGETKKPVSPLPDWLNAREADADYLRDARERLIATGHAKDKVKEFPAQQVILLDEKHKLDTRQDEATKWFTLPFWQGEAGMLAATKAEPIGATPFRDFKSFGPHHRLRKNQARLDQHIAMLRHIESLRLYAAENGGKLPQSLDQVKVPLPPDPVTGKQFHYKLDGLTATLRGTPPQGEESNELWNVRFELTVKK